MCKALSLQAAGCSCRAISSVAGSAGGRQAHRVTSPETNPDPVLANELTPRQIDVLEFSRRAPEQVIAAVCA